MSESIKFKALLHWKRGYDGENRFYVYMSDMTDYGHTLVGEQEFEYTLPENFDPVPIQLAVIDAEEKKARAEFAKRITELQRQRNELLAIEMTVEAA